MIMIGNIRRRAEEVMARCRRLATFSQDMGSIRRTFLSSPMRDCHNEITRWMTALGMSVRIDGAGNLRGRYPAQDSGSQILLLGSHLDTVPNAGAYDGVLGVVLAVSLLEALEHQKLPFALEVVGFSEEEGVRFGIPFIGSRALVGRLDDDLSKVRDKAGISVAQAIAGFGLNPDEIPQACLTSEFFGYIEFHIEQGPVLESLGLPLAAVEAIAGQSRMEFTFCGQGNHAGATPMNLRFDALAAAAEWITAVEARAQSVAGLVATVGKVDAFPGATNVIAAEARLSLDVRHASDEIRSNAVNDMMAQAEVISSGRKLSVRWASQLDQSATPMDPSLIGEIEKAIAKTGCPPRRMVSGAGHDAMIIAEKLPSAMIFLRSPGGISHDPAESVAVEDVEKAIECGLHLLDQLAASRVVQERMHRAYTRPYPQFAPCESHAVDARHVRAHSVAGDEKMLRYPSCRPGLGCELHAIHGGVR
jgi:allantoate deiminase